MAEEVSKLFVATKAFIEYQGKVLILRESSEYADGANAARYDVPGGRLTPGEHFKEALQREIKEETGLEVVIGNAFFANEWRPVVRGEQWQIVGTFFRCTADAAEVTLSEDHNAFEWIDPKKWESYNLIPNLTAAFAAYNR